MRKRGRRNSYSKIFRSSVARRVSLAPNGKARAARVFSIADAIKLAADRLMLWSAWFRENPEAQAKDLILNLYDLGDGLKEISDLADEAEVQGESGIAGTGQPGADETA
jgi:hypothetical protein